MPCLLQFLVMAFRPVTKERRRLQACTSCSCENTTLRTDDRRSILRVPRSSQLVLTRPKPAVALRLHRLRLHSHATLPWPRSWVELRTNTEPELPGIARLARETSVCRAAFTLEKRSLISLMLDLTWKVALGQVKMHALQDQNLQAFGA